MAHLDQVNLGGAFIGLEQSVESAKQALKTAKARERRDRKAAKRRAKARERARHARMAGLRSLHAIAKDTRKYSADARVEAAKALYEYGVTGNGC